VPNIGPTAAVVGWAAAMRTHSSGSRSSSAAMSLTEPFTSTGCPAAMRLPCYADFNAASTLSGVNGTERIRTPTAS